MPLHSGYAEQPLKDRPALLPVLAVRRTMGLLQTGQGGIIFDGSVRSDGSDGSFGDWRLRSARRVAAQGTTPPMTTAVLTITGDSFFIERLLK